MFKHSYLDTLRKLKKEQTEQKKHFNVILYPDCFLEINEAVDKTLTSYKRVNKKDHIYEIKDTCSILKNKTLEKNKYDELCKILPTLLEDNPVVNDDFLTGYYLAHIIKPYIDKNLISFHPGINDDQLIRGMWYSFGKEYKWNIRGCDKKYNKLYRSKYVNSLSHKNDIYDINCIRSLILQINDTIGAKPFDLYISDIKSNNGYEVLCQIVLGLTITKNIMIIRLPEKILHFMQLHNIITYMTKLFNYVSLFKTPWGNNKVYLILYKIKVKSIQPHYLHLLSYLHDLCEENINLFTKSNQEKDFVNYKKIYEYLPEYQEDKLLELITNKQ
jgi:hypothetical protein